MKTIVIVLGAAFLIITGVLLSLIFKGGALKPAGVIRPAEIGADSDLIGKQIAVRLFPDFDAAKNVIWYLGDEAFAEIPRVALENYHGPVKPTIIDLRSEATCEINCWYLARLGETLPPEIAHKVSGEPTAEIVIQHFDRNEPVPEACENQKILTVECMRPVTVREVRRKIKSGAPHYFMQRYLKSNFYLYIEKPEGAGSGT